MDTNDDARNVSLKERPRRMKSDMMGRDDRGPRAVVLAESVTRKR